MDAIANTLQGVGAIRAIATQPVSRTAQEEADPLVSTAAEPSRYYSPVVRIDSETQRTVLQYRDGSDGKVLVQYPSEKQLEAYRSSAKADRAREFEKDDTGRGVPQPDQNSTQDASGVPGKPATGQQRAPAPSIGTESSGMPIAIPASAPRISAQVAQAVGIPGESIRPRAASISA
jgi:hypothetical protein